MSPHLILGGKMINIVAGKAKYERGYNRLAVSTAVNKEREKNRLEYIEKKIGDQMACMEHLSMSYGEASSKKILMEKDIKTHRLYCYISAKLELLGQKVRERFIRGVGDLFVLMESNNRDFIKFLMNNLEVIAPNDYDETKKVYKNMINNSKMSLFILRNTLLAIKGDMEEVGKRSEAYLKECKESKHYVYFYTGQLFLKALSEGNKEKMKEAIELMMEPRLAKKLMYDLNPNYDFYLHMFVIIYAKIAMYHGYDLEIDYEVAPKELIDNTPLERYEDPYEFMKAFSLATITQEEWRKWTFSWPFRPVE